MDALRQWIRSDLDVIMAGTWMLCENIGRHDVFGCKVQETP